MSHTIGKYIAVILAIWLPLFSGNALAVSVAMQSMGGDCHSAMAQQDEPRPHCVSTVQQHEQLAAVDDRFAGEDCGTCHLACCSYLAAAPLEMMADHPSAGLYSPVSTQFQSITSTPLDPPPLARA